MVVNSKPHYHYEKADKFLHVIVRCNKVVSNLSVVKVLSNNNRPTLKKHLRES